MRSVRTLSLTLALSALLPVAAFAQAQETAPPAEVHLEVDGQPVTIRNAGVELTNAAKFRLDFDALDRNGDGVITRDELAEDHPLQFEWHLADRNRNGRITREEYAAWRGE